jgi:hypothetical protein
MEHPLAGVGITETFPSLSKQEIVDFAFRNCGKSSFFNDCAREDFQNLNDKIKEVFPLDTRSTSNHFLLLSISFVGEYIIFSQKGASWAMEFNDEAKVWIPSINLRGTKISVYHYVFKYYLNLDDDEIDVLKCIDFAILLDCGRIVRAD